MIRPAVRIHNHSESKPMSKSIFIAMALGALLALPATSLAAKPPPKVKVKAGKVKKADGTTKKGVVLKGKKGQKVKVGKVKKADGTVKKGVVLKGKKGGKVKVGKVKKADGTVKKGVTVKKGKKTKKKTKKKVGR